jgi:Recombination endonuclease VII
VRGPQNCRECGVGLTTANRIPSYAAYGNRICKKCDHVWRRARRGTFGTSEYWQRREANWTVRKMVGFKKEQFIELHTRQKGLCAFCSEPITLASGVPDHDAKTGVIRGVVCVACNRNLIAYHDLETARRLVAYLERSL